MIYIRENQHIVTFERLKQQSMLCFVANFLSFHSSMKHFKRFWIFITSKLITLTSEVASKCLKTQAETRIKDGPPHTTSKSAEQTCVHTLILIYGGSGTLLPASMRSVSAAWSLTPWWLFSVPDWRSQQTASGPRVHLSLWSRPSPGSETRKRKIRFSTFYFHKYLNKYLMDWHEIPCRRSWSPEDES